VMLIGFNLAPVVANIYWPQDQWVALLTMLAVMAMAVGFRGFLGRIAVFLGLVFGYVLSWLFDRAFGQINSFDPAANQATTHFRVNWSGVQAADWIGFPAKTGVGPDGKELPGWHFPDVKLTFVLLVLPAVIALIAENTGHVKAVAEMTGTDLDPVMGRAIAADGVGTVLTSAVGGSPTTTYAENIGVMAATRIYSTAAYYIAALVAILFGLSPKFGAVISATPGGVLGGITVVLYGMIGLLGAKIWKENGVDFGNPINLVPVAAGVIIAIGNTSLRISDNFEISGIAFGTIVTVAAFHLVRLIAPPHLREDQARERAEARPKDRDGPEGTAIIIDEPGAYKEP
jgi:xanthine/uracil permease